MMEISFKITKLPLRSYPMFYAHGEITEWILAQIVHLKSIRLGYVRSSLPIRKCIRLVTCVQVSPYKCMLCANIIGHLE